jgi:excisionase family DNA binding protein
MSEKTDRTPDELTVSVVEAGRLLGLGRNASYEAATRGDLPTIRIGGRIFVPRKALDALLDSATEAWQRRHEQKAEVA